jgi:hypothetical protein
MANTYVKIGSTVTVGSGGAANMQFTSIPATYTDLLLVWSGRSTTASYGVGSSITFNGSPTYSGLYLQGTGAGTGTATQSILNGGVGSASTATASTFGNASVYIPNYTSTTNKSVSADAVSENNATNALAFLNAGLATLTTAITTITIAPNDATNWVQYSSATLYGISKS